MHVTNHLESIMDHHTHSAQTDLTLLLIALLSLFSGLNFFSVYVTILISGEFSRELVGQLGQSFHRVSEEV